jgi:hypothetical protein
MNGVPCESSCKPEAEAASIPTYGVGLGTAINASNSSGTMYVQVAAASGRNDGLWGVLDNVAGQFAGSSADHEAIKSWLDSDESLKAGIEPVGEDTALEQVVFTPVSEWRNAPAKMAECGVEMPIGTWGKNTGPMAQDEQRLLGDEASSVMRTNLVLMVGKTMADVKALDKRVTSVSSMLAGGRLSAEAA